MMADCAEMPANTPEVSLLQLNEEVNRVEQMGGFDISSSEESTACHPVPVCGGSDLRVDGEVNTMLEPNNVPSQALGELSQVSYYLASDGDVSQSHNPEDLTCFVQPGDTDRSQGEKDLNESFEYIDSVKDYGCNNSLALTGTDSPTTACDLNCDSSEGRSITSRDTANSAMSVDSQREDSMLESARSAPSSTNASLNTRQQEDLMGSVVSIGSDSTSDREEFTSAQQSANSSASSESDNNNPAFKPGELTGKLIEGPRITLPPSQLPVVASYPSPSPSPPVQGPSTGSAPEFFATSCQESTSAQVAGNAGQGITHPTYAEVVQHEAKSGSDNQVVKSEAQDRISQSSSSVKETQIGSNINVMSSPIATTPDHSCDSQQSKPPPASASSDNASPAKPKAKRTPNDFIFGKVIGEGSYSTVYLAKEVSTQKEFAIKVCDKKHLIRERKTHFVMREKEVLMKLDHPFFIKLAYTFQDPERLYYVLTYARNGELLGYLHKLSAFDVPCTRFYSAEIVLALEYLHGLGIIHRDLKPQNILLGEDMHIQITDFGTSKILSLDSNGNAEQKVVKRKNSFVGTAEYVSPEILNNQPPNYGSDLWGLGCIIYQCLSGSLPFRSGNEYQTFQKIVKVEYDFPEGFHPEARDLVQKLLVFEPMERLGMAPPEGMKALKNHPFYSDIDWENLPKATPPKLMPYLPATASNPEFWGQEQRTGFDDQRLAEIITGQTADGSMSPELEEIPIPPSSQDEDAELLEKLKKQKAENQFHQFVEDNLIIRQGFVDKRKGLFARKRMLLLTEGPHLYYVDAHNKVLKGEIPWSKYLRPEAKNFKIFFVHTPNRTYYLESRQPDAQQWVKQIKDIWVKYYGKEKDDK